MSNKKQNEELQSRREFFKKAAKAALPVVGAVVLSNVPFAKVEAASSSCMYLCNNSCQTECTYSCYGSCSGECKGMCKGDCKGSCQHHCTAMQAGY